LKVLLDECIDWRLGREIIGHEVRTARQMGWSTIKNGELLALAARDFDVFVTVDRNLSFQQDLPTFSIAVVVLRARSNRRIVWSIFGRWFRSCWQQCRRRTVALSRMWSNFSCSGREVGGTAAEARR
jgi:hypothetical protein